MLQSPEKDLVLARPRFSLKANEPREAFAAWPSPEMMIAHAVTFGHRFRPSRQRGAQDYSV